MSKIKHIKNINLLVHEYNKKLSNCRTQYNKAVEEENRTNNLFNNPKLIDEENLILETHLKELYEIREMLNVEESLLEGFIEDLNSLLEQLNE